ncbi:MAG: recombinase family protein [Pirellulales bacterium]
MTIAAYIRVSSDQQDTQRQRNSIEGWATRNESIALWFEDSAGRNPRDLPQKRKGFQQLLKAVEAGIVKTIVVDSQDRFGTRDAYQWGSLLTILKDNGCRLLDSSGKVLSDDDDASVLTSTIGALTSSREQREKSKRITSGKIVKAKRGEYLGGFAPYGTDVVCFDQQGNEKWRTVYVGREDRWKIFPDGKRERFQGKNNTPQKDATDRFFLRPSIEKDRVKIVRQIFKRFATEDITANNLAWWLNSTATPAVFHQYWSAERITKLLKNPVYIGLPAFNKSAAGRFSEYTDGQLRDAHNPVKTPRAESDYIQPEKPIFPPIVDQQTWDRAQEKLKPKKHSKQSIRRAANTGELWLRPFLRCGICERTMRASKGQKRMKPNYFCATYAQHGRNNPTGCHAHRVSHDVIESIVLRYLDETAPKVADLVRAVETGDLELGRPLVDALLNSERQVNETWCDMLAVFEAHGNGEDRKDWSAAYGAVYERIRPQLEAEIAEKESQLETMLDDFRELSPVLRKRAAPRMESLEREVDRLKGELVDLREPWSNLLNEVRQREAAIEKARESITGDVGGRRKGELLRAVVGQVYLYFSHSDGDKNHGKSRLREVNILPVDGAVESFTEDTCFEKC